MKLSMPRFELREWIPSDFERQKKATKKLVALANGAGAQSDAFKEAIAELLKVARTQRKQRLYASITSPLMARAYAYLLAAHDGFANHAFPTNAVLTQINSVKKPLGRLMTGYFVRAFFNEYDRQDREALGLLSSFINAALVTLPQNVSGEFALWRAHKDILFAPDAPKLVVKSAVTNNADLDNHLKSIGLGPHSNSAFVLQCRRIYYISVLETIPVGSDHQVLKELMKSEVHNALYEHGERIGHKALKVIIDRSDDTGASDAWQRVVLSIAGDPRVGVRSPNYAKWWQLLGKHRIKKVVGWLSRLDLRIFLEVLEAWAGDKGDDAVRRMYPPRKKFMEGLLESGLVVSSRLFLTTHAELYLRTHYRKEDLPEYAVIKGSQTSVIYLELQKGLHLVEGTHSAKLKILDKLPEKPNLTDYGKQQYEYTHIQTGLVRTYLQEAKQAGRVVQLGRHYLDQTHHPQVTWQSKAIQLLKHKGLPYKAAKLLSAEHYREFKATNPAEYWS